MSSKPKPRTHKGPKRVAFIPDYGPDQILTVPEWAALNSFSVHTAYRILYGPEQNRPVITQLSSNRVGVSRRHNLLWQQARARSGAA